MSIKRIFHDPIHKEIVFDAGKPEELMIMELIDTVAYLGIPLNRFGRISFNNLNSYFTAARGGDINGKKEQPLEMTKWFNTNYHYLVPEIDWKQSFKPDVSRLIHEYELACKNNYNVIPKIIGPATLMALSKEIELNSKQKSKIINVYLELFNDIKKLGISEIMLDEGGLAVGDHFVSQPHFDCLIEVVQASDLDIRINGYFGSYDGFLENLLDSSIKTIHLDLCEGNFDIEKIIQISERKNVYLGVINGRSIWRNDLKETLTLLEEVRKI